MKLYRVIGLATHPQYNGEKNYSQKFIAYNTEDDDFENPLAEQYDENNFIGSCFTNLFLDELVMSETGGGAILKLNEWQKSWLPREYLTNK